MQEQQEKIPNGQRGADSGGPAQYNLLASSCARPAAALRDLLRDPRVLPHGRELRQDVRPLAPLLPELRGLELCLRKLPHLGKFANFLQIFQIFGGLVLGFPNFANPNPYYHPSRGHEYRSGGFRA